MHRRTRFLLGIVLLVTMGLSVAEWAWAAACGPDMGAMSNFAMASMDGMDEMREMADIPGGHDCMPGHAHERTEGGDRGAPCPFAPAGAAQGCLTSALLPGFGASVASASRIEVTGRPSSDTTPHLLRTSSIFHPPKT